MYTNVLNTDLSGKVAVVTGAGGVLCSEFSKVLARAGAKVALLNRTVEKAQKYADEINAQGGTAKAYACNVLDKAQCEAVAAQVLEDFGPCDILVNGAGGNEFTPHAGAKQSGIGCDKSKWSLEEYYGFKLMSVKA